jgi:cell wall-associated NlpC family hydrolase
MRRVANDAGTIVARARALIGTRFRPQGRSPDEGMDCLGVVAAATAVGREHVPAYYPLRGGDLRAAETGFEQAGFERIRRVEVRAGDVLIARSGPEQLHAVVLTPGGYVHAHAGLRRVVETPGVVPWPVLSAWRLSGAGD